LNRIVFQAKLNLKIAFKDNTQYSTISTVLFSDQCENNITTEFKHMKHLKIIKISKFKKNLNLISILMQIISLRIIISTINHNAFAIEIQNTNKGLAKLNEAYTILCTA
jgi:hypothetical protein